MVTPNTRAYLSVVFPLWTALFCFTVVAGLLFQKVILPSIPSLHAGYGLMNTDAIYFHQVAELMAVKIQTSGWSWETIWPTENGAAGHVAILAGLYVLFGNDPSIVLPVNAALHATSGVLVFLIVQLLYSGKVAKISGIIAAILFVSLPSSLNWYAQVHKDGYAIAGTLIVLYSWLRFYHCSSGIRSIFIFVGGSLAGVFLILFVRPYNVIFLTVATAAWIFFALIIINKFSWRGCGRYFLVSIAVWLMFFVFAVTFGTAQREVNAYSQWSGETERAETTPELCSDWHWQQSSWLPVTVERYVETAARARAGLICANFEASSNIDRERLPSSVIEVVEYMPRALAISLLGPFPDMWFSSLSMTRLVGTIEMLIWYLLIPGVFLAFRYNCSKGLLLCTSFSLCYLAIYGFTIGNLGTLHRVRYPFLTFFMAVGVFGWFGFLSKKGILDKWSQLLRRNQEIHLIDVFTDNDIKPNRKRVMGLGVYVSVLTLLGFIGFFCRDILMARIFGLTAELDGFFVALLIPMTIITIACIPLGLAFTPLFLSVKEAAKQQEVQALISSLLALTLVILFVICGGLYFFVSFLLPYMADDNSVENIELIRQLTVLGLPILLFSGPVIIGNAVLNALGKVLITGTAQLVVPLVAILAVFIYGESHGSQSVILGMVIGQLVNFMVLHVCIKKYGYSLRPLFKVRKSVHLARLASQYFPLAASAFFVSIALLVNTLLAMSLPEGGVAVFNLGNKVVLLITGIIGAAISTVMLPYFSLLVARNHMLAARSELSMFLLLLTCICIPFSVVFFVCSEQIIEIIFWGGNFGAGDVTIVSRVMQYAVVQIPFFACNMLLLKFAMATKHVFSILLVAVFGLLANVDASLFFMEYMGVAGIALGASFAMVLSTVLLVLLLARHGHVGLLDTVTLLLNWMLFITLLVSVHFESMPGVIVTISTYLVLLAGYVKSLYIDKSVVKQVLN